MLFAALSSAPRGGAQPSLLSTEFREHLSRLVDEYHGLQSRAEADMSSGSGDQHHKLYQQMATLEPVVKMVRRLQAKEQVCLSAQFSSPCM